MADEHEDPRVLEVFKERLNEFNIEMNRLRTNISEMEKKGEELAKETLKGRLENKAKEITDRLVANDRLLIDNRNLIEETLKSEAEKLLYHYEVEYSDQLRKIAGKASMKLRGFSSGAMTFGDAWNLFLSNMKDIFFGPWIWGGFLIFVQWMFISAFVSPTAPNQLYFVLPLLLGGLTFMLNLEGIKSPLDWIVHIVAGTIIGFSTLIMMASIITPNAMPEWGMMLWVVWGGVALFVGVFQFYHSGGFIFVFQISILILLFGYIALGPYSGYYRATIDQVKVPIKMVWDTVSDAVSDVWLLATDPTEWYAKQQLMSVRPEKPLYIPKGVEITQLSIIPATVPACEEFSAAVVIQNQGDVDANNIRVSGGCEEKDKWCSYIGDEPPEFDKDKLRVGEGDMITVSPFIAKTMRNREAETRFADVFVKVGYTYSTNSSLTVDVMSRKEIERLFFDEQEVYRPVLALSKGTPAQLSLNVGPQPKKAGDSVKLLISVINRRDDGDIILRGPREVDGNLVEGDKIYIRTIGNIGTIDLATCKSHVACSQEDDAIECEITPKWGDEIRIKPNDFESIFYFTCDLNTPPEDEVPVKNSGLITAELSAYEFEVKKTKKVTITTPLGIIDIEEGIELPPECLYVGTGGSGEATTLKPTTTPVPLGGEGGLVFSLPVSEAENAYISQGYGEIEALRFLKILMRSKGDVIAVADGKVTYVETTSGDERDKHEVIISHGTESVFFSKYFIYSDDAVLVSVGDTVTGGDTVIGTTNYMFDYVLYYEKNGEETRINPCPYLGYPPKCYDDSVCKGYGEECNDAGDCCDEQSCAESDGTKTCSLPVADAGAGNAETDGTGTGGSAVGPI